LIARSKVSLAGLGSDHDLFGQLREKSALGCRALLAAFLFPLCAHTRFLNECERLGNGGSHDSCARPGFSFFLVAARTASVNLVGFFQDVPW
jgi:hypothetical protein